MPQNILSGKLGFVSNDSGGPYSFGKWTWEAKAKMVPVPNFNSAGFEQYVVGLIGGKVSISGPYDQGNMGFVVGNLYQWNLGLAPSVFLSVPGILEGIKVEEDSEGAPSVALTVQTSGIFDAVIL